MSTYTPWGPAQTSEKIVRGLMRYTTAGHGGYHLSPTLNQQVPQPIRNAGGWYEEDCAWAAVVYTFPELFTKNDRIEAIQTLKNWMPDEYEAITGTVLVAGESHIKDQRVFNEHHREDYLVLAAVGDWHHKVPKGFVAVFAGRGGRLMNGRYPTDTKWFLVPTEEYRDPAKFVVDPERHQETEPIQ